MNEQKITSALELSKYKITRILYWVVFRPVGNTSVQVPQGEEWISNCHPKVLYERGIARNIPYNNRLPRLHSLDFQYVMDLLTSEPIIEKFEITAIHRSYDTGEFYYANQENEWMPEDSLFQTPQAALKEKIRIKSLFAKWARQVSPDEV